MYAVQAVRRVVERFGTCEVVTPVQVPTFYLDADVLGILDEGHAEKLARLVLGPGEYHVSVGKL